MKNLLAIVLLASLGMLSGCGWWGKDDVDVVKLRAEVNDTTEKLSKEEKDLIDKRREIDARLAVIDARLKQMKAIQENLKTTAAMTPVPQKSDEELKQEVMRMIENRASGQAKK